MTALNAVLWVLFCSLLFRLFFNQFYFKVIFIEFDQFSIEFYSHNGFIFRYNEILCCLLTPPALQISGIKTYMPLIEEKIHKYTWRVELIL